MTERIRIHSQAGHTIRIENSLAHLYDRNENLLGAYPHRQQAEAHAYIFNHGYQQALGDMGEKLKCMNEKVGWFIDELSSSGTPVYEEDRATGEGKPIGLCEVVQEMRKYYLELSRNYDKGTWQVLCEVGKGTYNYDLYAEYEEWFDLTEWFDSFRKEKEQEANSE